MRYDAPLDSIGRLRRDDAWRCVDAHRSDIACRRLPVAGILVLSGLPVARCLLPVACFWTCDAPQVA